MGLTFHWAGPDEIDRVAETRALCFSPAAKDLEMHRERIRADQRGQVGDFLLAERDGQAIGTTTSLRMHMWVRGGRIPCHGVAYVGTIRTHRRGGKSSEKGVASQLMALTLAKARERGDVVSALMPFRGSYYEHFGYGMVERRNEWLVPLSLLPSGDIEGVRMMRPADLPLVQACQERMVRQGQCEIERTSEGWAFASLAWPQGYCIVDQPVADGPIQSWMQIVDGLEDDRTMVRVADAVWDSPDALLRQLRFLGGLRDQYPGAQITLPVDVPLNWLLKETQLPHRPVVHGTARVQTTNRLQLRILDHARFLEALHLPTETRGRAVIAVAESEGTVSRITAEFAGGRVEAKVSSDSGPAGIECSDRVWAAIACGDLPASTAAQLGLIRAADPSAVRLLDVFSDGPAPYCGERF